MISYLRRISSRRAYAIHDGLLNEWGLKVLDDVLAREVKRTGAEIRRLRPAESIEP